MLFFNRYKQGFQDGLKAQADLVAYLREELALARKREIEANERADLAADRLLTIYGSRGISAAFAREEETLVERRREDVSPLESIWKEPEFGTKGSAFEKPEEALIGPIEAQQEIAGESSG